MVQTASVDPFADAISPMHELAAYEALWDRAGASVKTIAEQYKADPDRLFSDQVNQDEIEKILATLETLYPDGLPFHIRSVFDIEYPQKLYDATYPIPLLYFIGDWELIDSPAIAVVGTRSPSPEGERRTRQLVRKLVEDGFTIISGLASGVDTVAHETAIAHGGRTIAVIGTSIDQYYPKANRELQKTIANNYLLISQVPLVRSRHQHYRQNSFFFPERNKLMSAISLATVIVEAGESSGTQIQAREALKQGRKLFILNNNFENPELTWPARFAEKGAIRVESYQTIQDVLGNA